MTDDLLAELDDAMSNDDGLAVRCAAVKAAARIRAQAERIAELERELAKPLNWQAADRATVAAEAAERERAALRALLTEIADRLVPLLGDPLIRELQRIARIAGAPSLAPEPADCNCSEFHSAPWTCPTHGSVDGSHLVALFQGRG